MDEPEPWSFVVSVTLHSIMLGMSLPRGTFIVFLTPSPLLSYFSVNSGHSINAVDGLFL